MAYSTIVPFLDHLTRVSSPNLKASKTVFILASGLILIGGDRSEEEFCVIDFDESLCSFFRKQRAVLIRGMVAAAESLKWHKSENVCANSRVPAVLSFAVSCRANISDLFAARKFHSAEQLSSQSVESAKETR